LFFWQRKRKATQTIVQQNKVGKNNEEAIYRKSMIWQYFVRGKKRFNEMVFE